MSEHLRLADLLGGLSIVSDLGYGLPVDTALRSCLIGTILARQMRLPDREVADVFYVSLLFHVGCAGYAHETFAQFGDDLAVRRAAVEADLTDVRVIFATFITTTPAHEFGAAISPDGTWVAYLPDADGGFADRAGTSILLIRPAFWSALLPLFPWCSGAIVPKLFPRADAVKKSQSVQSVRFVRPHRSKWAAMSRRFRSCTSATRTGFSVPLPESLRAGRGRHLGITR